MLGDQGAHPGRVDMGLDGSGRLHVVWYRPGVSGEDTEADAGTVEGIVCAREGCIS
ncbi:hypothetical protein [Nocardiopsis sp. CC223A]|uniref:hypothetical protein n=1 Tax=Nocardiopsis sp. CC223A TaxID=3044051 RepID=UPI00278C60FB|nr:hypothetical protein [Nocardiopsis sp. CC223A]